MTCNAFHHNDTTGTDHRCQLADGHTGPHADPELRTSTRSPRGVHSMQWDDDGTEVPHTEHVHTAPRLVDTDGVGVTYRPPAIYAQPPEARMRDEQHRVLGKLVADVAERRDHTTQIDGVLIAPCDSRGYLVPILADDDTVAAPPELRDADRQPPAELRERVLADYDNGRDLQIDRAAGMVDGYNRLRNKRALDAGEVAGLLHAAQQLVAAAGRALDDAEQQRTRAEAAEADLAAVDQALVELHDQISQQ